MCVFAKCPVPGRSKTRIAPLLGEDEAALLATAMLSDIIVSLTSCVHLRETIKVLVYAPGSSEGKALMQSILLSLRLPIVSISEDSSGSSNGVAAGVFDGWFLLPMASGSSKADLTSSSLGNKLSDALYNTRKLLTTVHKSFKTQQTNESVLFLGMDAPELPLEEIVYGLQISFTTKKAHLCPADDGGYGMLSVPINAPLQLFHGVRWSNKLTAVSQLKALSDSNVDISIGKMMNDVDEPDDVIRLAKRLICSRDGKRDDNISQTKDDVLESFSSGIGSTIRGADATHVCQYTWKALLDLNVITKLSDGVCLNNNTSTSLER